jgi:hypothetical protein
MKILYTLFFFLLLSSALAGQIRERGLYISGGMQTYSGDYLWYRYDSGPHLNIEYRNELLHRLHISLGLSHTMNAGGLDRGGVQQEGQPYLLSAKEEPYAFATDADRARLLQTGIWPKRDRFDKLSCLKGEIGLHYDLIRRKRHRWEVDAGGSVFYFSDFHESASFPGYLTLDNGIKSEGIVNYFVPFEYRAFGIGWSLKTAYSYEFASGLSIGIVAGQQVLYPLINTDIFNSVSIRVGKRWGNTSEEKNGKQKGYELSGGAHIGYSSIAPESPGFGLSAGVGFSLNADWQIELGVGTLWAENDGGFRNEERLPVFIDNNQFVNPLGTFQGVPESFRGAGHFRTAYNRYYIGTLSLSAGRSLWQNDRSKIQADLGVGLNQVELIQMDYLLNGKWDPLIKDIFDVNIPVYRHQRFFDLGGIASVRYTRQLRGPWTFSARGYAQYMPVSAVFQGGLTAGIGVRF